MKTVIASEYDDGLIGCPWCRARKRKKMPDEHAQKNGTRYCGVCGRSFEVKIVKNGNNP